MTPPAPSIDAPTGMTYLLDVIQKLSMARDAAAVREIVRHAARHLVAADGATFVLRDGDKCHYVDEDAIEPLWKGQKFPLAACVSGWAMLNKQAAVIPDIYADARVPHDAYRPTFVKSMVMVPIRAADPIGAIGTYWAAPHAATPAEVQLLQALADTTAVALQNVRVFGELEDRVKARTAELQEANSELQAKNRQLQAAHEQANRVFAAFTHSLPGSVLDGKYQVYEQLGSGGFGVVLRGHHLMLDYPVAIKVFRPVPGNDSALELQRFLHEGATAARLNHPNAVRVLDSGVSAEGVAFLVMELLHGWTLGQELEADGPLPLHRAVTIVRRVAEVLAAAHQLGILHRDIKPDNVYLHHDGDEEIVKVVDFGIAKFFGDQSNVETARLTGTGRYVGTPAFVAPERVVSDVTDGRSDVFSLGVVLYEALTGVSPWTEDQLRDIASGAGSHLRPRPLRKFRPEVPHELDVLVNQTLSWKLADRPTAVELAGTLIGIASQLPAVPVKVKVRLSDRGALSDLTGQYAEKRDDDTGSWLSGIR